MLYQTKIFNNQYFELITSSFKHVFKLPISLLRPLSSFEKFLHRLLLSIIHFPWQHPRRLIAMNVKKYDPAGKVNFFKK